MTERPPCPTYLGQKKVDAILQLAVPVIEAVCGVIGDGEALASLVVLGGPAKVEVRDRRFYLFWLIQRPYNKGTFPRKNKALTREPSRQRLLLGLQTFKLSYCFAGVLRCHYADGGSPTCGKSFHVPAGRSWGSSDPMTIGRARAVYGSRNGPSHFCTTTMIARPLSESWAYEQSLPRSYRRQTCSVPVRGLHCFRYAGACSSSRFIPLRHT